MKKKIVLIVAIMIVGLLVPFQSYVIAESDLVEYSSFTDGFKYVINPDNVSCTITGYLSGIYTNIIPEEINGYTVTAIGDNAFVNISRFAGEITLPDTIESIGDGAFSHCGTLTGVHFGKNIKHIGSNCFDTCLELKVITGLENLESIGDKVFTDCYNLSSQLTFNKVTNMGSKVFNNTAIPRVSITCKNAPKVQDDTFSGFTGKVYIPENGVNYKGVAWSGSKIDGLIMGDMDKNGIINGADASMILDIYNKNIQTPENEKIGDMNRDGIVNGADASMVLDIYNKVKDIE